MYVVRVWRCYRNTCAFIRGELAKLACVKCNFCANSFTFVGDSLGGIHEKLVFLCFTTILCMPMALERNEERKQILSHSGAFSKQLYGLEFTMDGVEG